MAQYIIFFNQQWVGEHTAEWFRSRGPLSNAVVEEIKAAGEYVFAGGLEEDGPVFSADATSGTLVFSDGPFVETKETLGGFYVVEAADLDAAIAIAKDVPAPDGGVEVRPIMEFE